jgi:serine/alanine adding enzyme
MKNKGEWNEVLDEEFSDLNDVYYRYEYFELYKKEYNANMEGIFWEDDNIRIFWTHLIRNISEMEYFKDFKYYDLTTPYGYGGPLIVTKVKDKVSGSLKKFFEEYENYALKNDYISEFIRFHPFFGNWKFSNRFFDVKYLNDVVIVDLSKDLNEIWENIKKGHKYNIRKSMREGCEVEITSDASEKKIENFMENYYITMNESKAPPKYYFSRKFISDHFNLLNAILIEVKHKNEVIGTSIFICGDEIIHYHLSGTTYNFKGLYPSDLTLWEAIEWAKRNGFKYLHLGGGLGKNDSLFEFKRGFSKITSPFYVGKKIFNMEIYQKLLTLNPASSSNGYFPAYRQGFNEKIV